MQQRKQRNETFSPNVVYEIDLEQIVISPFEPQARRRSKFKESELESLGDSIKIHGLAQPIVLRSVAAPPAPLQVVFGERRLLASRRKGLNTILAFVRKLTDAQVLELQYEENHRQQQNDPLDDAFFFKYLMEKEGYTEEQLADRLATTRKNVADKLKLNDLIPEATRELESGILPLRHAYYISRFPESAQKQIVAGQLAYKYYDRAESAISYQTFKEEVEENILRRLANSAFELSDPRLHVRGLLCRDCPDNSALQTHLFPELADTARCLNKACFEVKTNTHLRLQREEIAASVPNPTNVPVAEIVSEVPLVTERKYTNDRVPFTEKVLVDQNLLDAPECEFSELSLAVEGAKKGRRVYICRKDDCPVHHPKPPAGDELPEEELTQMETEFDERVANRVRLKILQQASEWFDDRRTFWMFDDLIKNLIVEFIFECSAGHHGELLWLIRDWKNAPRNFNDKERLRAFVSDLDKTKQSQILFLLSVVGTEDLEVLKIAKGYTNINFFLLDAETRFELAPTEFKSTAKEYLDAVKRGHTQPDMPRFWRKDNFDHVEMVTGEEQ